MAAGVFVGLSTVDLIHAIDIFPVPDSKVVAHRQELSVGGPATNAAIVFAHLGSSAALVAAVGHHRLSAIIRDELERYSIDLVDLAPAYGGLPALSSVWVDRLGRRSIVSVNTSLLADVAADADPRTLSDARILLVDGHSIAACSAWAHAARSRRIPVVLDGGSWKKGTEALLTSVDVAICSADFKPPGCADQDEVIQYLRSRDVQQIAITRGAEPILFVSRSATGSIAVPQVDSVDSTGAGDILHGAFCHFSLAGCDFVEALRRAATVASESCRYHGTRRWMERPRR